MYDILHGAVLCTAIMILGATLAMTGSSSWSTLAVFFGIASMCLWGLYWFLKKGN